MADFRLGRGILEIVSDSRGLRGEVSRAVRDAGTGQRITIPVRLDIGNLRSDVTGALRSASSGQRISVPVAVTSSGLRGDVAQAVRSAASGQRISIPASVASDGLRGELERAIRTARTGLDIQIPVHADTSALRREVSTATRTAAAGQRISIPVSADTAGVNRDLGNWLRDTRTRFASAGRDSGNEFGRNAGTRAGTEFGSSITSVISRFDFLPSVTPMFAALASAIAPATAGVLALGSSLGLAASSAAAALPAMVGLGGAIGTVALAFSDLEATGAGRALSATLQQLEGDIGRLRATAQQAMLPGVTSALQDMRGLLPQINTYVRDLGSAFGDAAQRLGEFTTSPLFRSQLQNILNENTAAARSFADSAGPIAIILTDIAEAAAPLVSRFAAAWEQGARNIAQWVEMQRQSGALAEYFRRAGDEIAVWWRTIRNFAVGIIALFRDAAPAGMAMSRSIESISERFRGWATSESARASVERLMRFIASIDVGQLSGIAAAIAAVGVAIRGIGATTGIAGVVTALAGLGPVGLALAGVTAAVAALAAGFGYLYATSQQVRDVVDQVGSSLLANLSGPINDVRGAVSSAMPVIRDVFIAAIQDVGGYLSEHLFPALREAYEIALPAFREAWNRIVSTFQENRGELQQLYDRITTVVSWLTDIAGPLLGAWAILWSEQWSVAISMVINAFGLVNQAISAVIAVVQAVATAATSVWNALSTSTVTIWNGITAAVAAAVNAIVTVATNAWNAISTSTATIWNAIRGAVTAAAGAVQTFVTNAWNAISTSTATIWNAIGAFFTSIWNTIRNTFSSALSAVGSALTNAWNTIRSAATSAWNAISTFFRTTWTTIQGIFTTALTAVRTALSTAWSTIRSAINTAWNAISTFFRTTWTTIRTTFTTALTAIRTALSTAWSTIRSAINTAWNAISTFFRTTWTTIRTTFTTALTAIRTALSTAWSTIRSAINTAWNAISTFFRTTWTTIRTTFTTALTAIRTALSTAWSTIRSAINTAWNAIVAFFRTTWTTIQTTVRTAVTTVRTTLDSAWSTIRSNATTAWNAFRDTIRTTWDTIRTNITDAVGRIRTALSDAWGTIRDQAGRGWDAVRGAIATPLNRIAAGIEEFINHLAGGLNALGRAVNAVLPNDPLPTEIPTDLSIPRMARGGRVTGMGDGTSDDVPIQASHGEYVLRARAVRALEAASPGLLDDLNQYDQPSRRADAPIPRPWPYPDAPASPTWPPIPRPRPSDNVHPDPRDIFRYQAGGLISEVQSWLRNTVDPLPYEFGGVGPNSYDCCLPGRTLVHGPFGPKRIDELQAGDLVWSRDDDSHLVERKIVKAWRSPDQTTYRVDLGDEHGRDRRVDATANHPFLRATGGETEWARLDALGVGDVLVVLNRDKTGFDTRIVLSITELEVEATYDLNVEGNHNFIANGVVVHNSGLVGEVWNRLTHHQSYVRRFSTRSDIRPLGFESGHGAFTIGVSDYADHGHTAGNLSGLAFEAANPRAGIRVGNSAASVDSFQEQWYLPQIAGEFVSGGGAGGGGGGGPSLRDLAVAAFNRAVERLRSLLPTIDEPWNTAMQGYVTRILDGIRSYITSHAPDDGGGGGGGGGGTASQNRALGREMAAARGWTGSQWTSLDNLWQHESGWNHLAENPSSGAYGIPQALPGSKMASAGSDWRTNPRTQIRWGLGYIAERYTDPNGAWRFWQGHNWYDDGGVLPPGPSLALNTTGRNEQVLSPEQIDQLVAAATGTAPTSYNFEAGAITLDASKIRDVQDLIEAINELTTSARQYGAEV